jgi:hypothetical protein
MVGEAGRNKLVKSLLHIWPQWLAGLKPFVSICSHAPRITNHLGDQCFKRMMRNRLCLQPMLRRSDHRGQLRPSDLKCCTHTPLCLRLGHPDHLAGAGRLGPNKPDVLADVGRLLFKPDCALRHAKGNCAVRKSPGLRPCDLSARPVARGSCKDDPRRPALAYSSMPSFALTRSCTAFGLALPPVAFITWPTNQPASAGLAWAWRPDPDWRRSPRRRPRWRRCR